MFADSHMSPEIDRPQIGPDQPSLDQMTRKAIELLSLDPDGFFLMVEGSQIDWACHANDPAYLLSDLLAYDKAVQAALDFAKKDGNTLVLALSDHNTGGFSIGNEKTGATYSQMKTEDLLDPIRKMKTSSMGLWKMVEKNETPRGVRDAVKKGWGMDISPEEAERILSLANRYNAYESPHYAFGEVLCPAYTVVGWTTHGHTGGDVPLHAFGPGQPAGVVDAPQIARICAGAMGFDLTDVDRRLFVESGKAFADAKIVANRDDDQNPVAVLDYQGKHYAFPVNKNLMKSDGKETELKGVVVY
jgi:alkaline phosphatase